MSKIFRYFKPFILLLLLVFGLLFVQAMCDLALPDYMSNIVNNGIQQGGIENAVPEAVRKSEFDRILLMLPDKDRKAVQKSYTLLSPDDDFEEYGEKYPALGQEPVYMLNETGKGDAEALNPIMGKAILVVSIIEETGIEGLAEKMPALPGTDRLPEIPPDTDPFALVERIPAEYMDLMREQIDGMFSDMSESMITQSAVEYIKDEYAAIGMDTGAMQINYILRTGLFMLLVTLLSIAAAISVGYLAARFAAGAARAMRRDVFQNVTTFSNIEMDRFSTASLITRTTNDIQQVQMFLVFLLRIVFFAPILGIGGIIRALSTETSMAWTIALAVGAVLTAVIILFNLAMPRFRILQRLVDRINLVMREALTGIPVIRAFNTQKQQEKKFDAANRNLTKTHLFVNRIMVFMMPFMLLVMNGVSLLIVWVGSQQVDAGTIQVGNMMAFIQYAMMIIMSFLMLSMVSIMLPRASVAAGRIAEVIDTKASIHDPDSPETFDGKKKGYLKFKDVSFRYPGADDDALSGITFTAKPGETTAIIGGTGSGKSTLVNLIPRFYDVTKGKIRIDGRDIRSVTQYALRKRIGYIPQKAMLFSGTVASNLRYGDEDSPDTVLKDAADAAQAMAFIERMPGRFEAPISQGGVNVSGGQKQRLAVARALVKKPDVYIFDDSFSALDFKTDAALRKALKQEIQKTGSTVIIVAQRIGTVRNAEQIIVLNEGKIAGIGTHSELMKSCGVYSEIAYSQLSREELES